MPQLVGEQVDFSGILYEANHQASSSGCVWDVAFLPDGDLVTACADYVARVWTVSPDQAAPAEQIKVGRRRACCKCAGLTCSTD